MTTWWRYAFLLGGLAVLSSPAHADTTQNACKVPGPAVLEISLPGRPFGVIASPDGCTIFVSMTKGKQGAVAALQRSNGQLTALGSATLPAPMGLALTHDGAVLIAAQGNGTSFVDTKRLASHQSDTILGAIDDGGKGAIYVATTPDDTVLFISDERSKSIGVVDLAKARRSGFAQDALIGSIPVGQAPVGLAVSPDGKTLFAAVEVVNSSGPRNCRSERGGDTMHHEGALFVIAVDRAKTDPAHAVVNRVAAGCNPVRVVLSPDRAYVTARGSNALLIFDTAKILSGQPAPLATIAVGNSPVGVALSGSTIIVTNSDRYGSGKTERQSLSVIDVSKPGAEALIGTVEVGAFPRELSLTPDGKTLLVTNAGSNSLSVIDLARMPIQPAR